MFGRFEVRYVYLKAMPEYDIRDGVLRSIKPCAEAPGEIACLGNQVSISMLSKT